MNIEYEVRVLEIDKDKLINKLEEFGATLKGSMSRKDMYIMLYLSVMGDG